ncbi:MAG: hypothetical protein J7J38_02415 [Candidatus Aenigmarchaeota archaeon]|nr:hypothetical protein [Candidatus Aenigmarchaeota archaeon]
MLIPFDITAPVSSTISLLVECVVITISLSLANLLVEHGIEIKRIIPMALIAYFVTPIVGSLIAPSIPIISYLLPLVIWVILGEFILTDIEVKKKALIAALGYAIFFVLTYINLQGLIFSLILI